MLRIVILILFSITANGQNIYKTPSGKKYHLATCRMVENVSHKITLGHIAMGLKVREADGNSITFIQAFKRRICDAIEISWCFGMIAFVLVKSTKFNQRLGDIWAKTLVVDKNEIFQHEQFDFKITSDSTNVR